MKDCAPIKAAVIGAGHIARQHLNCLRQLPGVETAAVCDLSPATAESAAERYAIPQWFTNHRGMLERASPQVVHIATPPASHYRIACDAIEAGCHVLIEKPVATSYEQFLDLRQRAEKRGVWLLEDHNLRFNSPMLRIFELIDSGQFGQVVHAEMLYCLNLFGPGNPFTDRNCPHPCLSLPGGAIADFLPHLAYLACALVGPHRSVSTIWQKRTADTPLPSDEFRAMIQAERGTALVAFSAHSQPDGCWLWIHGTKMRATANLYTGRLSLERAEPGSKTVLPFINAVQERQAIRAAAFRTLWRKVSGRPLIYEGLWELLARLYRALANGEEPPIAIGEIDAVSRLVADLTCSERQLCAS